VTISNNEILAKRAQAQAMVNEAEAALIDAQKDYERITELHNQQSASLKELENARLHYNSLKAKTDAARQMKNEAEAMLAYTNLTAPFSGVVTQRYNDVGSMANPGMPILAIEQPGRFEVVTSVSESDVANVKEGANATISIKSSGKLINGKVSAVSPSSQMSGGQYQVKVDINDDAKNDVYSGMYVNVAIASSGKGAEEGNVLVPASAIVSKDQLSGLYTVSESQTALLRWVKVGRTVGDQVEILSGLSPEEKFILKAEGKLFNGTPLSVNEATSYK
jgi:RND family efflux transporter MFP subunit